MVSAPLEKNNREEVLNSKRRMGVGAEKPSGGGSALANIKDKCYPSEVKYWGLGCRASLNYIPASLQVLN